MLQINNCTEMVIWKYFITVVIYNIFFEFIHIVIKK